MFWVLWICSILVFHCKIYDQVISRNTYPFPVYHAFQLNYQHICTLSRFYAKWLGHTISYTVKILMDTKIACDSQIIHTCWLHWDRRSQSQEPPRTRPPPSSTALATMAAILAAFNPLRLWPPEGGARPPPVFMVKQPLESPEGSGSRHLTVHSFAGSFSEIEINCINNIGTYNYNVLYQSISHLIFDKGAIDIIPPYSVYF